MDRTNSFELIGFDFMVDASLQNVWLLECNSSPDLSYSTSTTKSLVKQMLSDMASVLGAEGYPDRRGVKKKWGKKGWSY